MLPKVIVRVQFRLQLHFGFGYLKKSFVVTRQGWLFSIHLKIEFKSKLRFEINK